MRRSPTVLSAAADAALPPCPSKTAAQSVRWSAGPSRMPRTYSVSSPLTARPCARPTSMMSSSTSTSSGPTSPLVVSIQVALLSPATTLTSGCSCYMETCALSRALSRLLVIDCSLHRSGCYHFENQADCTSCGYNSGPQRERRAFKQREPRPAGTDVGPAEAAGLSVRRHLCWKGVAQRQNIPRPRAPSSPSIAVGRRLRPTTPRPCGSCAAALVARRRSPSRDGPYTPAATTCGGPRARGVVSTLERHSGRAMGATFTRPTAIVSGSARARAYGVGYNSKADRRALGTTRGHVPVTGINTLHT